MSDKRKGGGDDSLIPAITPAKDEVASYRRSGRAEAPKQSNFNGLLVFVIVLLSIMMGIGGYALWEVQAQLEQSTALLSQAQKNVDDLERRLSATGDQTSRAFQDMEEQVATNFAEIDKLWGVSYRRNRPNIEQNTKAIEQLSAQINEDLRVVAQRMTAVDDSFQEFSREMIQLRSQLRADNEELKTEFALVRGQVQDQAVLLENNRRSIATLEQEMNEANEAIEVIDQYRARINQQLLELRSQVQGGTPGS